MFRVRWLYNYLPSLNPVTHLDICVPASHFALHRQIIGFLDPRFKLQSVFLSTRACRCSFEEVDSAEQYFPCEDSFQPEDYLEEKDYEFKVFAIDIVGLTGEPISFTWTVGKIRIYFP